jgi:hypothetical protein
MIETGEKTRLELGPTAAKRLEEAQGPIVAHFQVTKIPEGKAPLEIKEAWLTEGLSLPIRQRSLDHDTLIPGFPYYASRYAWYEIENYETPAAVTGLEAIIALRNAEQHDAAEYWKKLGHRLLAFHRSEGILTPIQLIDEIADL